MKKKILVSLLSFTLLLVSCKKNKSPEPVEEPVEQTQPPVNNDNYASLSDFYAKNAVVSQRFELLASAGGTFVSAKGSTIQIPPNAFVPANAQISVEFRDIYKKSDMLLSKAPTVTYGRLPLKSAGEFFLRAMQGNLPANTNTANPISVLQPVEGEPDKDMKPFVAVNDSSDQMRWVNSPTFSVSPTPASYVFDMFQYASPMTYGSWCNSDNSTYFSAYQQTLLTMSVKKGIEFPDVFLVFKDVTSMVHVYAGSNGEFPYSYAPKGLSCTVIALGVKNGKLHASFTPITISANMRVACEPTEISTEDFKAKLKALD